MPDQFYSQNVTINIGKPMFFNDIIMEYRELKETAVSCKVHFLYNFIKNQLQTLVNFLNSDRSQKKNNRQNTRKIYRTERRN